MFSTTRPMNAAVIDRESSPVANRDRCMNGNTIAAQKESCLTGRASKRGTDTPLTAFRNERGSVMEELDMWRTCSHIQLLCINNRTSLRDILPHFATENELILIFNNGLSESETFYGRMSARYSG